jgi:hypothetical protein
MYKSAAEEIGRWADQCQRWASRAQTTEQRLTLRNWQRLFSEAAVEAQDDAETGYCTSPKAPTKS